MNAIGAEPNEKPAGASIAQCYHGPAHAVADELGIRADHAHGNLCRLGAQLRRR